MRFPVVRRKSALITLAIIAGLGMVPAIAPALRAQSAIDAAPSIRSSGARGAPLSVNPEEAHAAAPTITASPVTAAITIDGKLDDPAWASAIPATEFTQTEPIDGAAASERTEVRILYDDEAIYVGAYLHDSTGRISSRLGRRDSDLADSDWFIVVFDSYHDHTDGFRFKVNPAGVIGDEAHGDRSWNPVWTSATHVDSAGWSAEMRIPFSQLRFSGAENQVWGIQFYREIRAKAEKLSFSYTSRSERAGPSRFGHLLGLHDIKRGKTLELLPYLAGRAEFRTVPLASGVAFANPFRSGHDYVRQAGADIKYRLTSNFTVDATLHPDFGQIEADESQVNLSANELFLREQRPFFVEGASTFHFGGGVGAPQLFYSRRVGRAPQGSLPGETRYADVPSATAILGAAKVTGRTANGWSIGVMQAVTGREDAPWVDSVAQPHTTQVEPLTNYVVARAQREMRAGRSNVGAIVTAVERSLGDSALSLRLRSSAYVAGVDFGHLFGSSNWELSGFMVGSRIAGAPLAITAAQRSSVRYFQRPDASYLAVDSAATQLSGWTSALTMARTAGVHWTGNVRAAATSPGYEINDLGFQNSADRVTVNAAINYDESAPGAVLRRWGVGIRPEVRTNFGGDVLGRAVRGDIGVQLLDYVNGGLNASRDFGSLDDRLTRGGPLAWSVPRASVSAYLGNDVRKPYTWNVSAGESWDESGGWWHSRQVRFGFKPSDWWSGELAPGFSHGHGTAQYITRVTDALAEDTFGVRYIFAPIDQTTLSLQSRLNLTVSPTLNFSFVAEPFLASGKYGTPEELRAARTYAFNVYGSDVGTVHRNDDTRQFEIDPDGSGAAPSFVVPDNSFNTRSMNATANLKWEWHPGSSLFLVWQHRRSNAASFGDFDVRRDVRGIFGSDADNTLLFKLSYWLNS